MFAKSLNKTAHAELIEKLFTAQIEYIDYLRQVIQLLTIEHPDGEYCIEMDNVEVPTIKATVQGNDYFSVTDGDDVVVMFTDISPYIN